MNTEQIANIDATVTALSETLTSAWGYLHLLRGLHEGGRENPEVIERFSLLFDQTWQAIFEGLFAKTGTLLDKKSGTYSLPNLVTMIRRYGDANSKQLFSEVEACLSDKDSLLEKIKCWRHQAVAHHPLNGRDEAFYTNTKMTLDEIESALMQLEEALNRLSCDALSIINDTRTGSTCLVEEGRSMFTSIAVGIVNQTVSNSAP